MQNVSAAIDHLEKHQTYPASKEELVKTCNSLSDFSKGDKEWFEMNLPSGNYNSASEVMDALSWEKGTQQMPSMV